MDKAALSKIRRHRSGNQSTYRLIKVVRLCIWLPVAILAASSMRSRTRLGRKAVFRGRFRSSSEEPVKNDKARGNGISAREAQSNRRTEEVDMWNLNRS